MPAASPIRSNDDVDRPGVRVSVGRNSAYDLYLTRHLKQATLVRVTTSQGAIDEFAAKGYEVVAGVKQPVVAASAKMPGTPTASLRRGAAMNEAAMATPMVEPMIAIALVRWLGRVSFFVIATATPAIGAPADTPSLREALRF